MLRPLGLLLLASSLSGCVAYEYEHELWLEVDGSGTVSVVGRPDLWRAFKGADAASPEALVAIARGLFESSGLRVRRAALTRRGGRPYVLVSADFPDVNRLSGTPAFPDLSLSLRHASGRLVLEGTWKPPHRDGKPPAEDDGLLAVRFHLPSRVYGHRSATFGVERGNILAWTEDVRSALGGTPLELGADMDERSILGSTVLLFAGAIAVALTLLLGTLALVLRKGRLDMGARPGPRP